MWEGHTWQCSGGHVVLGIKLWIHTCKACCFSIWNISLACRARLFAGAGVLLDSFLGCNTRPRELRGLFSDDQAEEYCWPFFLEGNPQQGAPGVTPTIFRRSCGFEGRDVVLHRLAVLGATKVTNTNGWDSIKCGVPWHAEHLYQPFESSPRSQGYCFITTKCESFCIYHT